MSNRDDFRPATSVGLDPNLEQAVPDEQRPVNELAQLKDSLVFSWATLDAGAYFARFATVWVFFYFLLAAPVAAGSFDPAKQPVEFVLAGATGGLLVVSVLVLRIYLGWAYVGNRLLSATVEYEETGWYDGQIFVKPPEVLTRDRLLGTYQVKPVLLKLRQTLLVSASALLLSSLVLAGVIKINGPLESQIPRPREINMNGVIYSERVRSLDQLRNDDEAAEAEAAAMNGVPGYCADRYLRAAAGGQYCAKFEGR